MRKAYFVLAIATCASSLALAQTRDPSADSPSTADGTTVQTQAADTTADRASAPKSAFGQVMAVLTHLLQKAATSQATGTESNASHPDLSSDDSAVTIIVTPIDGQTTFTPAEDIRERSPAPPRDAQTRNDTQLAVQPEEGGAG